MISSSKQPGLASARVLQVIEVRDERGSGTEDDIFRSVYRYFTFDGALLAEYDSANGDRAGYVCTSGSN